MFGLPWGQHPIKKPLGMSKKDKMADRTPRRLCVSHFPFNGANFDGEGMGHFRLSGKQAWKLIWNERKIIVWSYWPYIYAEWLSNLYSIHSDVVSLWRSFRNKWPSHGPEGKSFNLLQFSPCVWKVLLYKKGKCYL